MYKLAPSQDPNERKKLHLLHKTELSKLKKDLLKYYSHDKESLKQIVKTKCHFLFEDAEKSGEPA
jgi:hypothetical protein